MDGSDGVIRGEDRLMTPAEVANIFAVDPKTVTRWAQDGRIPCTRTLGGHRRFLESDVRKAITGGGTDGDAD